MAAVREEMRQIREAAGLPAPPREIPLPVMHQGKIGKLECEYCVLDRDGVTALGRMHDVTVCFDQTRGRYFELTDETGKVQRFTAGDYYVVPKGRDPMPMSEEDGQAHFGGGE